MTGSSEVLPLPTPFHQLSSLLETQPDSFISGNKEIQDAALRATEHVFNIALDSEKQAQPYISALLASFSPAQAPVTRSQSVAHGKRKRSPSPPKHTLELTPLTSLFVQNLDKDQIWAQLELRAQHVCKMLECALDGPEEPAKYSIPSTTTTDNMGQTPSDEDGSDIPSEESDDDSEMSEEVGGSGGEDMEECVTELRDESVDGDEDEWAEKRRFLPSSTRTKGSHSGLDDGFFDLAEFNAETEEAEAGFVSNGALDADSDTSSAEDEIDYFGSIGGRLQDDGDHELRYADFFDAPNSGAAKKKSEDRPFASAHSKVRFHDEVKVKTIKARGKGLPVSTMRLLDDASDDDSWEVESEDEDENDLEGVIQNHVLDGDSDMVFDGGGDESGEGNSTFDGYQAIKRSQDDLLADEDELDDGMSTHEKRLASLQRQIAALEAENVAKKDWTLMGEATSRIRPHDSLLEEDLEFERVMKAVPVITEEIVSGLEDRIKARILEGRFDDVVRKRPVDDKPFLPSRFFELQDTKSKQSLAQIYEEEYTATQTGDVSGEDRDGKLKSEYDGITKTWEAISSKLDALSNAHFTPKTPKATISTVANVSSTSLESTLPTSNTFASMLAPEEIYERPAIDPRAQGELSPREKRSARNKRKKVKKKARDTLESRVSARS
ncbi:U3 small nucleolar ribonucleoprotein complex, subunit Mpp10 [Lactarius akahatsu]|uniref:U3 small nucleolar ribonucleoprotein protein MPP10 n=1 Tax=Lactarius akahatsu TaxID=416441 RepID=A0AAD4LIP2_9AGAM|nr:U3 small nucleolar ribonucleoprotein complex, subunit Mpp10 [Lactarius akahatsu]